MKKLQKTLIGFLLMMLFMSAAAIAQPLVPQQHGFGEDQPAPIGSGMLMLLTMGAAYGAKKVYDARKRFKT